MKLTNITECRECGSESLTWQADNRTCRGCSVQNGRLRLSEVEGIFVLGCDECCATLAILSADKVAEALNASHAEGGKV